MFISYKFANCIGKFEKWGLNMSCTYYLRDRKITSEIINKLKLLEKEFNSKLDNFYE